MELEVSLGEQPVGVIAARGSDASAFRFYDHYKDLSDRLVLGQAFEDDLDRVWRTTQRLPPFFSNLLPDLGGALRTLVASQLGRHALREFPLLAHLGGDLPGAVKIAPLTELDTFDPFDGKGAGSSHQAPEQQRLRFSLAGVQLKFSALRNAEKLTMPAHGVGGDWVVKLPDLAYSQVPENEHAIMSWARASGIDVPSFELIDQGTIENVPPHFLRGEERLCYIIERFDRTSGARIHIEDFAQVLSVYGSDKYDAYNFETIASVIASVCSADDVREHIRRLVFMVLSGNADMHLKNWSLIYPDGVQPRLSPAYDLLSTIIYPDIERSLALNFKSV